MPSPEGGLEDAVAGERIGKSGGVSDQRESAGRECGAALAERKVVAANVGECGAVEPVRRAEPCQVLAKGGRPGLPFADPDVEVVAFGEDPTVPAMDRPELENETLRVALDRCVVDDDVSFERDRVR